MNYMKLLFLILHLIFCLELYGQGHPGHAPWLPDFNINWNNMAKSGFKCSTEDLGINGKAKTVLTTYARPSGYGEDYLGLDTLKIVMEFNFNSLGLLESYYSWDESLDTNIVWLFNFSEEGDVLEANLYTCYSDGDRRKQDCKVGDFHNWDKTTFLAEYDQGKLISFNYKIVDAKVWNDYINREITLDSKMNFYYNEQDLLEKAILFDSVENKTLYEQIYYYSEKELCDSIVYTNCINAYNNGLVDDFMDGVFSYKYNNLGDLESSNFSLDKRLNLYSAELNLNRLFDLNGNLIEESTSNLRGNNFRKNRFTYNQKNDPIRYNFYRVSTYSMDESIVSDTTIVDSEIEYVYDDFNWILKTEVKVSSNKSSDSKGSPPKKINYLWTRKIEYY